MKLTSTTEARSASEPHGGGGARGERSCRSELLLGLPLRIANGSPESVRIGAHVTSTEVRPAVRRGAPCLGGGGELEPLTSSTQGAFGIRSTPRATADG